MSALTGVQLKALADSIAATLDLHIDTSLGAVGTAGTVLYGMQANVDRIKAYTDVDPRIDLERIAQTEIDRIANQHFVFQADVARALENHIRRTEDVSMSAYWLSDVTGRIPPRFAQLCRAVGIYLAPALVFPPVTSLGTFVASGAGAGTFTDGSAIDLALYGAADLEAVVTAKGGASVSLVATVTGKDANGSTITGTATFVAAAIGDKVNVVPTEAGAQFYDITNITITGGAASDAIRIQTKYDRALSF